VISPDSTVKASSDQVSCEVAGEAVILNLKDGTYYGLDPIGARIWSLLSEPRRVREICDVISNEYDVTPTDCDREVRRLLDELATHHLLEMPDGSG
jgi:hypothetical protein